MNNDKTLTLKNGQEKPIEEIDDLYYLQKIVKSQELPKEKKWVIQSQIDKLEWLAQ